MNKTIITLIGSALIPLSALGVPALPTPIRVTNPDGTIKEIQLHGDEYYSYVTDVATGEVLEWTANGWAPSATTIAMHKKGFAEAPRRIAEIDTDGRTKFPTLSEEIHGLVILMEFADTKFTVPNIVESIDKMLNQEGYSDYGAVGSARDYYIATSGGKFKPTFDIAPIVVTLPEKSEYYVGGARFKYIAEALEYAVKAVDEVGFDFSKYDYDNDGDIDNIFFYYAGFGQSDTAISTCLWPHQGTYTKGLTVDGVNFKSYACSNELKGTVHSSKQPYLDGVGTFIHEFAHVLGLPDFYDAQGGSTESPIDFDALDIGSHNMSNTCPPLFNAYERWMCHWLDYTELTEPGTYTMEELAKGGKAYRISTADPNEYFILESRGNSSWDKSLPGNGIAIWHVRYDKDLWVKNGVNISNDPHFRLVKPAARVWCWDKSNPYIAPMLPTFLQAAGPNPGFDPYIMGMTYHSNGSAGFRYTFNEEPETATTTMHTPTNNPDVYGVNFSWDAVEGATDYLLTVYIPGYGDNEYISGMNEYSVGNVTSFSLNNISISRYRKELNAHIRPVTHIPSINTSEDITFIPRNLESGIEGLTTEEHGVEYYNLQGVRITNPQKGETVIKRSGSTITKEIIR